MTQSSTEKLDELSEAWSEENAAWAKDGIGNNDNAEFIFKAGHAAGKAEAAEEIAELRENLEMIAKIADAACMQATGKSLQSFLENELKRRKERSR